MKAKQVAKKLNNCARKPRGGASKLVSGNPGYSRSRENDSNTALKVGNKGAPGLRGPFGSMRG